MGHHAARQTPARRQPSRYRRHAAVISLVLAVIGTIAATNYLLQAQNRKPGQATVAVGALPPSPAVTGAAPQNRVAVVRPTEGPAEPTSGVYLGAWAAPPLFTQAGSIAAVQGFEQLIGRRLDIVHTYLKWEGTFPTPSALEFLREGSTLLISWQGASTRKIAAGVYDPLIRQRAQEIRQLGEPVFLEWRWEMARPGLRSQVGSPADFIAAWKHIRAIFAQQHVRNAAWVWCPSGRTFVADDAAAYYPGDSQVDWICADIYPGGGPERSFYQLAQPFLVWASQRPKPVMIGEFGVPISYGPRERVRWLRQAERVVRDDPRIRALLYFEADPAGHDARHSYDVSSDPAVLRAFRSMADSHYFNPDDLPVQQG